jgi:hypothetical protein
MRARLSIALTLVCVLVLAGHVASGHAHLGPLDTAPLEAHATGDEHHAEGASCAALRSPAGASSVASVAAIPVPVLAIPDRTATAAAPVAAPPSPQPPLFLLHAALLI